MKILLCHSFEVKDGQPEFNAISYHRINKPHQVLTRLYPEFEILHTPRIGDLDVNFLKNFEIVIFLRFIDLYENLDSTVKKIREAGCKIGLDIDDYWYLYKGHLAEKAYIENKLTEAIIESIKESDFVITTTPILQDEIKKLNKNVVIIENGIDPEDSSWQPNKQESERIRFGFLQGSTHVQDLYLINHDVVKALETKDFQNKGQVCLAFYYKNNEPSVYVGYEKLLTNYLNVLSPKYKMELLLNQSDGLKEPYRRLPFKPVHEFGTMYNEFDVSVCPLVDNHFNNCKSELKMIEAGFMDCAVMVSDVNPYSLIATKDNSFLFSERDFFYHQKFILKNPSCLLDKKAALKETVKKYDLRLLSEKRKELYETISRASTI